MSSIETYRSDYLFSDMNFVIGMGSLINIAGNYYDYNISSSPEEADLKALKSDWGVVGKDIRIALEKYSSEKNESEK